METPDFRFYFLIRIKLARTVIEIHGDMLSNFPDSCPGLSTLQRWHTEFDKGVFALEKKTRPGRPRETRTEENVARVKRLVENNPRMTSRKVAAEVSLPSSTVFRLLTEDLGLRNLLSVLVPHQFSEANKTQRVKCCQDLLKLFQDHGEDFLGSHLLVQDESWFYWDLAERRQVWAVLDPPCETDSEEDDDSDGAYLQAETQKDKIRLKDCLLMGQCTSPHCHRYREFLTRRDVEQVKQSPYSPDLSLCDRSLFRKLKHLLRGDEFGGHEEATLRGR
ncbi:Transposase [Caligus rogercresseyi]|uniref:Transposase n=1 Tax=Caligus rogercresseyi TaxID=217165 RepID=A0A7T8H0N8_CALRO|nr:Transposase [Caligus rogercresseyi]